MIKKLGEDGSIEIGAMGWRAAQKKYKTQTWYRLFRKMLVLNEIHSASDYSTLIRVP